MPFPSCQTLRTRSGQICPLLRHVSSRPPEPREPPHWQQPTTKEDYYHRGHRQQDPSQWQDWDDWGKWKTPTSNDQSTWQSRKADHAHSTTHQHSTWDNTRFHSHHPAARLSAGSRTPNLLPPSPVPLNHITGPKNGIPGQTWSDTGDHSRGSSSLPAGHMQISLHDGKPSG